jgi:hypothetical protein
MVLPQLPKLKYIQSSFAECEIKEASYFYYEWDGLEDLRPNQRKRIMIVL